MSEQQHTKEPWANEYRKSICGGYAREIFDASGITIASIAWYPVKISPNTTGTNGEANARRIVAAVNACAGFSIEELEGASLFNDSISAQDEIDSLKSEVEEMKLIIATDTGTESAVAAMQKQRDELLAALKKMQKCKSIYNMFPSSGRKSYGSIVDDALASVKASE